MDISKICCGKEGTLVLFTLCETYIITFINISLDKPLVPVYATGSSTQDPAASTVRNVN